MSYERLAQRLIETQEAMLGRRAIDVAQSIAGLSLDDGTVTDVDGGADHDRVVIATLVDEYVSIMGQSAHNRFDDVVAAFEDDLVLPENLGGPATVEDASTETGATTDATAGADTPADTGTADATADADAGAADATADTGTVDAAAESTTREATVDPDADGSGPAATGPEAPTVPAADDGYEPADPEEVVTNIWGEEHQREGADTDADPVDVDIESVYITITDAGGWEKPVPIRRALIEAVTNVTDLTEDDLADLSEYVDTRRIVRLLETDATDPVSFEVEGHVVTLHADGGIHVE